MLNEQLINKWQPVLDHEDLPEIKDSYRRLVTAQLLEQQEKALVEEHNIVGHQSLLGESSTPPNSVGAGMGATAGDIQGFDPVLISLVRRTAPQMIAFDIMGTQPMSGPTGMIFALVPEYDSDVNKLAAPARAVQANVFFDEANTAFTGTGGATASPAIGNTMFWTADSAGTNEATFALATGMTTTQAEHLGDETNSQEFPQMGFRIDKTTVTAVSRALKAEYTTELAQDLKAIHGLDAEAELANILTTEINAEINREIVRSVYRACVKAAPARVGGVAVPGIAQTLDGRWLLEKFEALRFKIEQEANAIAKATRRGKGNIMICSADVASALATAGVIDPTSALKSDDTGSTMAGSIGGPSGIKVFIDPYSSGGVGAGDFAVVGYKGTSPYDAGLFYCPYVPLQMVRAVGEDNFQPKIGFKTRYGLAANPFAVDHAVGDYTHSITGNNTYYRGFAINGLGQVTAA